MADIRSVPGLRYSAAADLSALVTPPYDVISPEAQARYYERHPDNIIRLELGRDEPDDNELNDRYTRAATTFAEWRLQGVLRQDRPSLYVYEQDFSVGGKRFTRVSLLARVRLEPWDARVVLPHERTLSKPIEDRLKVLRACVANLSPIMALYDDPDRQVARRLDAARDATPEISFTDESGEDHRLWLITDDGFAAEIIAYFRERQLYIADGHHRYETALTYRDEVRASHPSLPADDPTGFVLMALSAIEDPGLVVLPTHRIVRGVAQDRLAHLGDALQQWFEREPLHDGDTAHAWVERLARAGGTEQHATALVIVARDGAALWRLSGRGQATMREIVVAGEGERHSDAWAALDVAVLHELVLERALGITSEDVRAGQRIAYTRDAEDAANAALVGGADLAVLLNPTPPEAIRDVALAGDRMPQKSTYFYPKLITGLVINPLW